MASSTWVNNLYKDTMTNVAKNNHTYSGFGINNLENSPPLIYTLGTSCPKEEKQAHTLLQKKAWAKYKTYESMAPLIDLHSPFESKYWDTFHCCETLKQEGKYLTGRHCGNRWCRVCGRIATAKMIQGYGPALSEFQNPMFVTLTIVNVPEQELLSAIKKMIRVFNMINHNFRQRRPYRIIGIRKIEIEPSEHPGEYHPHFHIILEGEGVARALVQEWLNHFPTSDIRGQNITPCDKGSLVEFFKYVAKPMVKSKHTAYQLDVIYRTLYHKRVYQPIGITKCVSEDVEGILSQKIPDLEPGAQDWKWDQEVRDWVNASGEKLSSYKQNKEIPGFVKVPGYKKTKFNN